MRSYPELSVRKPQSMSIQRAIAFNAEKVNRFFDLMEETLFTKEGDRKIPASNIFNVDETGFTGVQKPRRIIASKGKKYVGALMCCPAEETGTTVTD